MHMSCKGGLEGFGEPVKERRVFFRPLKQEEVATDQHIKGQW